ncbi:MAG: acetyltransferase [Betaproteobacteria bacterium]|nr:acetyltransferase [Betaproteobacteria bacterium]
MTHFDVFNGDADGLCALRQLRLAEPREAVLVTGAKRDIALLGRVDARPGDAVTVLDLSAAVNHDALLALLQRGVAVEYFDHHFAGELPLHPRLAAHIDTSPEVCTGMVVDRHLGGRHRVWAVAAAFGDNLPAAARALAGTLGLGPAQVEQVREVGEALAYNAYGDSEADLIVAPAALYCLLGRHADPLAFAREEPMFPRLRDALRDDLEAARAVAPRLRLAGGTIHVLPDAPWSRRVRGALGNELASREPDHAHAILTSAAGGGYVVSVRAPLRAPTGADALCRRFPSGGGRAAAAGINRLPEDQFERFAAEFARAYPGL